MSLRSLLDRRVSLVTVTAGAEDRYGNRARTAAAPVGPIRARRDLTDSVEDVTDRDRQGRTFRYMLELLTVDGVEISPLGRDRIVDGADTLEIVGSPELVSRRRRAHHWEARAVIVDG